MDDDDDDFPPPPKTQDMKPTTANIPLPPSIASPGSNASSTPSAPAAATQKQSTLVR